jgi:hypothetical protein
LEDSKVRRVEGVQAKARNFISFDLKLLEEAVSSKGARKSQ